MLSIEWRVLLMVVLYGAAVTLAFMKTPGWGWFLFVAFMITPAIWGATT
jgi:hypothetical protein